MILVCFLKTGWIVSKENIKSLKLLFAFQPESHRKVSPQSQAWAVWAYAGEERGGENDAINLRPQRRVWRLIQDRIEDLRFWSATKGVYQSKHNLFVHLYRCIAGMQRSPACLLSQLLALQQHGPAAEGFLKTGSLRADRGGSANQEASRPWCSCLGLFLYPHSSVWSVSSVLLLEPKLLFISWCHFSKACLLSCEKAVQLSCPFVVGNYCLLYRNTG